LQNVYQRPEDLYFLPVGGTAMASLAGLLHVAGHRVRGVDAQLYPPMSELLAELGIPVRLGFDPAALPGDCDRVIIGNAVPRANPEVQAVLARRIPHLSQAEAVAHYLLGAGRSSMVVAGTHGKTTTSALLAWILESAGEDPTYLVGGMLPWSRRSFRLGAGAWMVIEGDEYNTAFFDRGPKLLHYRPQVFLLGPVEYDHADLYPDLDAVLAAFRAGSAQVPRDGVVVVSGWSEAAREAVRGSAAPRLVVGPGADADLAVGDYHATPAGGRATLRWQGRRLELATPLAGRHNLSNAAMALGAALWAGVAEDAALAALARFPGVRRRLEVVGEASGITVVDDFAHHPTALAATLAGAAERWPGRRLVVAYEPRSLTAGRRQLQAATTEALAGAGAVLVAPVFHRDRLAADELLDRTALARDLTARGVVAVMPAADDDPVAALLPLLAAGDVVLACSSGSFGGLCGRLLEALAPATKVTSEE
jgi:UDP-N-acetylmuramate: L-alanyl-gamma-D-glutamyl-meso-diaminopimelate ligase